MVKEVNNTVVQLNSVDTRVSDFIYNFPHVVAKLLDNNSISVKKPLTLPNITQSTFDAIYNGNEKFLSDLYFAMAQEGYSNFEPITMGISAGLSIVSSILGSNAAKKAREAQYKIALANLSQQKMLEEEKIRTGAETERTRILLQTLQQYSSDLQSQSTQRLKDVGIYVGILGVSIAIIYGVSILIKSK